MSTNRVNRHKFLFNLAMLPEHHPQGAVKMDGENLQGVTALHLKADSRGFTNVTIQFEAEALAEFDASLIAGFADLDPDEEVDLLNPVYKEAERRADAYMKNRGLQHQMDEEECEKTWNSQVTKQIILCAAEMLKRKE